MSIRPLDVVMSITQVQNAKPPDELHTVKDLQQAQLIHDQQQKIKDSIPTIPDDGNTSDNMSEIKYGLNNNSSGYQQKHAEDFLQTDETPQKEILDEDHGNSIDLMC